ncbi:hypothetical protein MMC25_000865 [Agyrium rufum]|nr:hypothetical protein [Agyrium rufum]
MPFRPVSSYNETPAVPPYKDTQYSNTQDAHDMQQSYRRSAPAVDQQFNNSTRAPNTASDATTMHTAPSNFQSAPDPLTRAFNEAVKPFVEQIEILRTDLEDANLRIQELEDERAEMHQWIDKRGLRPDLTPRLASGLPSSRMSASTFSNQLERKMTMLNFDLHRLADSLPSPLPTFTIAETLSALLPSIMQLASLPHGPPLAFELLIKLGGNINSHNTGEESDADMKHIADFYTQLDEKMVDVIRKRIENMHNSNTNGMNGGGGQQDGSSPSGDGDWVISKDVRRLEKTGTFLRTEMGLQNYFVRSLDVLRYEVKRQDGQGPGQVQSQARYTP